MKNMLTVTWKMLMTNPTMRATMKMTVKQTIKVMNRLITNSVMTKFYNVPFGLFLFSKDPMSLVQFLQIKFNTMV